MLPNLRSVLMGSHTSFSMIFPETDIQLSGLQLPGHPI